MESWRRYYDVVYKISTLTGTWPYLKLRKRILRVGVLTATMLTVFVPQMAFLFQCKSNVRCVFESMTSFMLTIVAVLKVYTFQLNTGRMKDLTQHLFINWKDIKSTEEYEIMKLYAKNSRILCLIYMVFCMLAVMSFYLLTLIPFALDIVWPLNESRPVVSPYPGYYFVDTREYFSKIFCHSIIAGEIVMTGIVAHDCMFVTYVEHICSIFSVIGYNFKNLFCNRDKTMNVTNDFNETYRQGIAFFVHTHRQALKFAEILEDTFTTPLALQLLIATVGISITLVQITQQEVHLVESIRYLFYVIGQLIHLFFLSFEGQRLLDHSLRTCNKIYESSWYEVSARSQKLIIMVMMKSARPSYLSAGKIYIFSLENFTTVLQTSMSYFTVLATV